MLTEEVPVAQHGFHDPVGLGGFARTTGNKAVVVVLRCLELLGLRAVAVVALHAMQKSALNKLAQEAEEFGNVPQVVRLDDSRRRCRPVLPQFTGLRWIWTREIPKEVVRYQRVEVGCHSVTDWFSLVAVVVLELNAEDQGRSKCPADLLTAVLVVDGSLQKL